MKLKYLFLLLPLLFSCSENTEKGGLVIKEDRKPLPPGRNYMFSEGVSDSNSQDNSK